jgi:hypothetical protein
MIICPIAAELFHADEQTDRRTDMTKLIVAFRNFVKEPKNDTVLQNLKEIAQFLPVVKKVFFIDPNAKTGNFSHLQQCLNAVARDMSNVAMEKRYLPCQHPVSKCHRA